jgi:uncharacterized membrane protein
VKRTFVLVITLLFTVSGLLAIDHSGEITSDEIWYAADEHLLTGQTFVKAGATLTIQAGTTIKSNEDDGAGLAPALVIERGAMIMAEGRADAPITFTTVLTPDEMLDPRGNWGGIIILGDAPIAVDGGTSFVEGLEGIPYGGNNPDDNSGVMRYVRVWHGGRSIGQDNEINGITLAGVGRGTTIEYCEVALNLDDGFEMFGGTVDLKYCDVLFVGDDAFDVDEGYQGRGQFLFAMVGADAGNRAHEMDSKTNGDLNSTPRSHPQWYNVTLVGSGDANATADNDQILRLREGLGGEFGNYIVVDGKEDGLRNSDNGSEVVTSDWATAQAAGYPDYLYWSPNNIINGCFGSQFTDDYGLTALDVDPQLASLDGRESGGIIDPRPATNGPAYDNVDTVPVDDFFTQTNFKGAFGSHNWLEGFSWLDENNRLGTTSMAITHSGDITSDETWYAADEHLLTGQTFVKAGATLTIQAGTTIKSNEDDGAGLAPALVIERGAMIMAEGRADAPITFTTVLTPDEMLDPRGNWGGIIILGDAPIAVDGGTSFVEGLEGIPYGGNNPDDNSGVMRYVRVWHGGRSIGQDNEINGITLAGVGRGTTIEYCEVALNLDDGFEMFGGTVDLKYCDVLFVGDDAFDVDEGYQGRGQFLFAMVGADAGNRAHEMDSKTNGDLNSTPRSHPQWYNVTLVGSGDANATADNDQILRLREGLGGEFGNYIVVDGKEDGLRNSDNGSEVVTSDWATAQAAGYPDYLYWSPNNIINGCFGSQFTDDYGLTALDVDPQLASLDGRESGGIIDPRPATNGPAYDNVDTVPVDDFFTQTNFKGAFGSHNWLEGFSWLDENGRLGFLATDEGGIEVPESSRLLGNYPNPFNPSTTIRFELANAGAVKLTVFDVTGRLVNEINAGQMGQGIQQISWNANSASGDLSTTGLYIYQIQTADETLTGKMMLLK